MPPEQTVSISCSENTAALAASLQTILQKRSFQVIIDGPADTPTVSEWGTDKSAIIDSAFDEATTHCIILLDHSYLQDSWYNYRRGRLLSAMFKRRGFVLPVQVGDTQIDIHGLTNHIGKIRISHDDAETLSNHFFEKVAEFETRPVSETKRPVDLKRILHLYNEHLRLEQIPPIVGGAKKVGYQYYVGRDDVTRQHTHFILLDPRTTLQATADEVRSLHSKQGATGPAIVLLPREPGQTRPEIRLQNVRTAFENAKVWTTNVLYLDDFIWQHCTPKQLQTRDLPFAIRGFVEPQIESPSKQGASRFLSEWYENSDAPILVIRGSGGIGKTTLTQQFANLVSEKHRIKVYFIDEETITSFFLRSSQGFHDGFGVYDAYRAHVLGTSESEPLSYDRFMLNFDNGNLLLIIDGIDQITARLGARFDVQKFLQSIYVDNSERRKVIITARSTFLPDTYFSPQITAIEVVPFDRARAEHFLKARFPELPKFVEQGLSLASSLTRDGTTSYFLPFLLDIVANLIQGRVQEDDFLAEDPLAYAPVNSTALSATNENDYIIYRVCAREKKKYPQGLDAEHQIQCLLELAVKYRGIIQREAVQSLIESGLGRIADNSQVHALLAHPLLHSESSAVMFRYDVVRQHFRHIYVGELFRNPTSVSPESVTLLSERNKFSPDFLRETVERIAMSQDEITLRAIAILEQIAQTPHSPEHSRARTTLLLIVMQQRNLLSNVNRAEATTALNDLYGDGNAIRDAAIADVSEKIVFDFRDRIIDGADFVNYDQFWQCEFNEGTHFRRSTLKGLVRPEGLSISAKRSNFDMNTCTVDNSVLDAISSQKERTISTKQKLAADIERLLRIFHKSGRLLPQKEAVLRGKYKGSWDVDQLISSLEKAGLISEYVSEKSKKMKQEYQIVREFQPDVLKLVLEDHSTEKLRQAFRQIFAK